MPQIGQTQAGKQFELSDSELNDRAVTFGIGPLFKAQVLGSS